MSRRNQHMHVRRWGAGVDSYNSLLFSLQFCLYLGFLLFICEVIEQNSFVHLLISLLTCALNDWPFKITNWEIDDVQIRSYHHASLHMI